MLPSPLFLLRLSTWRSWVAGRRCGSRGLTWWARHGEVDAMGDAAVVEVVGGVDVVVDDVAGVDVAFVNVASWRRCGVRRRGVH